MALSTIIKKECPTCHKVAVERSRLALGESTLITLECGHTIFDKKLASSIYSSIVSSDKRSLMPYQVDGVKFIEASNGKCLVGDEQGLGKTVQVLGALKLHAEMLPVAIATPTSAKLQWFYEVIRWCGVNGYLCQVISSGKERALPGFNVYIITYDLLKIEDMFSMVTLKTLVLDECQAIKNHLSGRAKAVQRVAKECEHIIGLSGTPIKNNAGEYFTVLNLLQPTRVPEYQKYLNTYCDTYESGYYQKIGGLKNPELFRQRTEDFIIRRTKAEVLPDLPAKSRNFYHVELDKKLNKAYSKALEELDELYYQDETAETPAQRLAIMNKLRLATGLGKVTECVNFVTEHLMSTDRKIVVFLHHHDVHTLLKADLDKWCVDGGYAKTLNLTSALDDVARNAMVEQFKNGPERILIASTLAAGTALNLQFCSDAIMLERQWNPPNEVQAEDRFHQFGQINPVSIYYMIASETIDEYFTELVEQKRAYVSSALDFKEVDWNQNSLMSELATILVTKGRKKWSL